MCIADMAAGRRTRFRRQTGAALVANAIEVPADPTRLRLHVASVGNGTLYAVSLTKSTAGVIALAPNPNGYPVFSMRVEEWGTLLMGTLFVFDIFASGGTVSVVEVLADFGLDADIQQEAG